MTARTLEPGDCAVLRRCRETGHEVGLYYRMSDDGPWQIVCEEHAQTVVFDTRAEAERFLAHPRTEGWCEVCSGAYSGEPDRYDIDGNLL